MENVKKMKNVKKYLKMLQYLEISGQIISSPKLNGPF